MFREKANYLGLRCVGGEGNSVTRRIFDPGNVEIEVNAEYVDYLLDSFLGSWSWLDVICPSCVGR
jgi:hypothetical protein